MFARIVSRSYQPTKTDIIEVMQVTITGANELRRKQELDTIVAAFTADHGDMAIERYDGEDTPAARMREAVASMPFLSERKLVVLREPSKQKAFAESISEVLADVADSTDLVIFEPKLDKRSSYYKTLKKDTDYRESAELDVAGLSSWAVEYITSKGGTLSSADARWLIERVGPNHQLIASELDKLFSYDHAITRASIELLTEPLPQSSVFDLLDAAFSGNAQRAAAIYHDQRALRVEPQAMLAMIVWQVHMLAVVKAGLVRGLSVDQIASEAKLKPFVVRKSQGIVRSRSLSDVKQMVAELLSLDMQLKRTAIDADEALQLFLLRLSRP